MKEQYYNTIKPLYSTTLCYHNLQQYTECGSKSKYCTLMNFCSQISWTLNKSGTVWHWTTLHFVSTS